MQQKKVNYYDVLGLGKDATPELIKQTYKKLALKYHPDKNQDKQTAKVKFTEISEAYTVLMDPAKRETYDRFGTVDGLEEMDEFFAAGFAEFEAFLEEMMFADMGGFDKKLKKMSKMRKGAKRTTGLGELGKMLSEFNLFDFDVKKPKKEKKSKEDDEWETDSDDEEGGEWQSDSDDGEPEEGSDDEGFNQEEMFLLPFFVEENTTMKGTKGKRQLFQCKIDGKTLNEDNLMDHFFELHSGQFAKWKKSRK